MMMIEAADDLYHKIKTYNAAVDGDKLRRAFLFGMAAHDGQARASGEPYFVHPIAVANILADMRLDLDTIITALLHDTVEDCEVTLDTLQNQFGASVAQLVDGVTKLSRIGMQSSQNSMQAENFRKLLLAMSEDVRVLLVKLADRTHNMRTISFIAKDEKRQRIARETLEIYAPLAERIGVTYLQHDLENDAFAVLHSEMNQTISNRLEFLVQESEIVIPMISVELQDAVEQAGIECSVSGRLKTAYSIWRKMQRKKVTMDQLSDIMAFRVLVPTTDDCYRALGNIHAHYPTVMGRFKDYVSTPKRNGYQSLHTGVIGPENHKIEIQLRTPEMHEVAENGVAAHWDYKNPYSSKKMIKVKANVVRVIPLPPISLKKGPVPICPPNKKVKNFFNKIGSAVEIKNEKLSINFWSTSGMMASYYDMLRVMSNWLVKKGIKRYDAQKYITSLFLALSEDAVLNAKKHLKHIVKESQTPKGLNEQGVKELTRAGFYKSLEKTLNSIHRRLNK